MKLQAGDEVFFELIGNDYVISKVYDRKNSLIRPYISNVDKLAIVLSVLPRPDFLLIDKLIVDCFVNNIKPFIIINKADIADKKFIADVTVQYEDVVDNIILTSAITGTGIKELEKEIEGNLTAFTGQSAVGKSSILNCLINDLNLKTGELSKRINIGKNTTRNTSIYVLNNNTFIADTPGFNMLHHTDIEPKDLKHYYPDFVNFQNKCQFRTCVHKNEQNCEVKIAVKEGLINKARYERYIELYDKILDNWRKKYD